HRRARRTFTRSDQPLDQLSESAGRRGKYRAREVSATTVIAYRRRQRWHVQLVEQRLIRSAHEPSPLPCSERIGHSWFADFCLHYSSASSSASSPSPSASVAASKRIPCAGFTSFHSGGSTPN